MATSMRSRRTGRGVAASLMVPLLVGAVVFLLARTTQLHSSRTVVFFGDEHELPDTSTASRLPAGTGGALAKHRPAAPTLAAEVWAGFVPPQLTAAAPQVLALLSDEEKKQLEELCARCLVDQVRMAIGFGNGNKVFVATGDIPFMWIRDSAVQLGSLVPRITHRPALRVLVEGAVRTQAFMIVQDPYANAYYLNWRDHSSLPKNERMLGRGGWVATRNYELDSGAYFIHLLWDLYSLPGYGRAALLAEPLVYEAVSLLVDIWTIEQYHEERSQYRYSELPREGRGPLVNYTGMSWCGFRPSDDQQQYGYNIPVNMYAQAAVERALEINANVWTNADFEARAGALARTMREGIERHGIVTADDGSTVYAYEVDGLGNKLVDFDDANVPSLLSIPLLGYRYDTAIYENTRQRILTNKNPYYFSGQFLKGIGSPHTPQNMVWPLAISVQGLTSKGPEERADMLRTLLKMQCNNGLMHESVNVDNLESCTRTWFGWANAMLVTLVEAGLGMDCGPAAERLRLAKIREREKGDQGARPQNGGADDPLYYETLEDTVAYDKNTFEMPSDVGGSLIVV